MSFKKLSKQIKSSCKYALPLLLASSFAIEPVNAEFNYFNPNREELEQLITEAELMGEESEKFNETVNLTFKNTKISSILLLLSKIADTNLIFPEELDKEVSIELLDVTVKDAIEDLLSIHDFKYKIESSTVIVSEAGFDKAKFEAIEVLYSNANDISETLNETVFKEIIRFQDDGLTKPYAVSQKGKNLVVISGTRDQIRVARDFIKELDAKPSFNFCDFRKLNEEEVSNLIINNFKYSDFQYQFESNLDGSKTLFIKGKPKELGEAIATIQEYEELKEPIGLKLGIFKMSKEKSQEEEEFMRELSESKLGKVDIGKIEDMLINRYKLEELHREDIKLEQEYEKQFFGIAFALKSRIDQKLTEAIPYRLSINGKEIKSLTFDEALIFREKSKALKQLKKHFKLKNKDDVVFLLLRK